MVIVGQLDDEVLTEAEERYARRRDRRDERAETTRGGEWLAADTPERVEKRFKRLGVDPGEVDTTFLERMYGANNLVDVSFVELALWVGRSVGRLVARTAVGGTRPIGTGFMVSPRLLLTNHHVLHAPREAAESFVEFGYQNGPDGRLLPSAATLEFEPTAFFVTDKGLDYSLVAIAQSEALTSFGWNRLIPEEGKVVVGEPLNVIGHPDGEPKKLALRENRLIDVLDKYLHYEADTAGGSSGSPVFNDQWEVVALHHSGAPRRDAQGRILTKEGAPWSRDMGEQAVDWIGNEGVRVSRIVAHVQEQSLATEAERQLRAEMFDAQPPAPGASTLDS